MPSEMASPPSDITLAESPNTRMAMKVVNGATTRMTITTSALRSRPRKSTTTTVTKSPPSISARITVASAAVTSSLRS